MADLGPSRAGQDQKRSPAESGARHHARRFVRTTLGDRGDVGGRPARLSPYLVVSVPSFKPPQASHKTQTRSCCSVRLGIGKGKGRAEVPRALRAPLGVFGPTAAVVRRKRAEATYSFLSSLLLLWATGRIWSVVGVVRAFWRVKDHIPTGGQKRVASEYAISFGGNAGLAPARQIL